MHHHHQQQIHHQNLHHNLHNQVHPNLHNNNNGMFQGGKPMNFGMNSGIGNGWQPRESNPLAVTYASQGPSLGNNRSTTGSGIPYGSLAPQQAVPNTPSQSFGGPMMLNGRSQQAAGPSNSMGSHHQQMPMSRMNQQAPQRDMMSLPPPSQQSAMANHSQHGSDNQSPVNVPNNGGKCNASTIF